MLDRENRNACVIPPGGGRVIRAFGTDITILLGGAQTGGKYTMFTAITPPGEGTPLHYHTREDEWFFVLEGCAEFFVNGAWVRAPAGTAAFVPQGVLHAFRNTADAPLKMLIHTAPSGFENFYARCAEEFAKNSTPDPAVLIRIAGEHGICFAPA